MKLLFVLLVAVIGSVSGSNSFSGTCYKCEDFNNDGQGFMEHSNQTMCCYYYECWRVDGSTVIDEVLRTCPPGTWFNDGPGHRGAPCTANKPYDECVSQCGSSEPITRPMCHLYPNPANAQQFGTLNPPPDGPWEYEGECMTNFVFDHSSCTCVPLQLGSCHCKLDIDFVGGVGDDSCMNADVINDADNPVTVEADASVPDGSVAVFDGTQHLAIPMFSGLDERGECRGCLSFGLFFKATADPAQGTLIQNADCGGGETWKIVLDSGTITWVVQAQTSDPKPITTGTWYYASAVFKYIKGRRSNFLKVYLMTVAEAIECQNNCDCPIRADQEELYLPSSTCVNGKSCGVAIGRGADNDFEGMIGRVQVSHKCHPMACAGEHCKKKGKRNRF